ncbi:MAG: S41 family peptidase [Verrucomicrobia bacterium]|nr:S41 family peptidase [Verrucomicrobiota bacterium]
MKKRILYSVLLTGLSLNLLLGAQIYLSSDQASEKNRRYDHMELFVGVLDKIRKEYVDGDKVSFEELVHSALKGMVSNLDPHSEFMEARKYTDLKSDTEGKFGGIGIEITRLKNDFLTVVAPFEGTPAFNAGILRGDKIIKIEGKSAENTTPTEAVQQLRGEPGSDVTITIARPSLPHPKDFTLTRAVIKVETVKDLDGRTAFPLGDDKIGYVRVTQFGEKTTSELKNALKKLDQQGMRGLILDLRGNPGGLLEQAISVCDLFVPRKQLVVSTDGRSVQSKQEFYAKEPEEYPDLSIVILVNTGSASASEIVAGCLQDLGRAFVMGEKTFGKGSVQSIVPLQDGSALRLTTAYYYTPAHKVIHGKGITPDSVVPLSEEDEQILFLQRVPGGIESLDPEKREIARNVRDVQLDRASDFLRAIIRFAGRSSGARKFAGKL